MWIRCFKPQGRSRLPITTGLLLACLNATASAESPVSGGYQKVVFSVSSIAHWSDRARPPNLGILMLRFPVTNMAGFYRHAVAHELDIVFTPVTVPMPPYGQVSVMAVRGPGGAWLEFFQRESGQ